MSETLKFKTEIFLRMEQELNRLQVINAELLRAAKMAHANMPDGYTHALLGKAITKAEERP